MTTDASPNPESANENVAKAIVETKNLSKQFGAFRALSKCSLTVDRGEIFGLLGPNGAGKTTLIRLLMGFIKPSSGSASINAKNCYGQRVQVHRDVAYLPGDARLFRTMTGNGVLKFFSRVRAEASLKRAKFIADRLELDLSRWVAFMSTGMRQKLALAVTMSMECPLIILDEPTANLDPTVRGEVIKMVAEARDQGKTVVFSSHVLSEIEDVCDRVGILRRGELVHLQSIRQLKQQHRILAELKGDLPELPSELRGQVSIQKQGEQVKIETPGELSVLLAWLADAPLTNVHIEPVGLRAVYDRFHSKEGVGVS